MDRTSWFRRWVRRRLVMKILPEISRNKEYRHLFRQGGVYLPIVFVFFFSKVVGFVHFRVGCGITEDVPSMLEVHDFSLSGTLASPCINFCSSALVNHFGRIPVASSLYEVRRRSFSWPIAIQRWPCPMNMKDEIVEVTKSLLIQPLLLRSVLNYAVKLLMYLWWSLLWTPFLKLAPSRNLRIEDSSLHTATNSHIDLSNVFHIG